MATAGTNVAAESGIIRWEAGRPILDLHPGQTEAWDATERFVAVLAGTQGG